MEHPELQVSEVTIKYSLRFLILPPIQGSQITPFDFKDKEVKIR